MKYDIALEMNKLLNEIYKIKKNASEEIQESDLPNLVEKFVKQENYLASGGNNVAFKYEDKVLLIPHRFNPFNERARTPINPGNVFEILKKEEEDNKDSSFAESYVYKFRNLKNSDRYHESLPIAIWGGKSQGQNIQIMEYLGEPPVTETQRSPSDAKRNMDTVFNIITDDSKIEKALDKLKEIKDLGYETDPKPDNLTIDASGEVRFIDLNLRSGGSKKQPLDYFINMLLPPYVFQAHPEKEKYREQVRNFIEKTYEYGKSIGLDIVNSIEKTLSQFNFATEKEIEDLKEQERIKKEQEMLERQKKEKEGLSPEQKADAKNIIFSINPAFSKYDPSLYSDISFLKDAIEEELYILIEDLRNGNVRNVKKINDYFVKNPDAIYQIHEAARENLKTKEELEENNMSKENYIKKSNNIIEKLIKLSDFLDCKKLYKKADIVDKLISFASDDEDDKVVIDFLKEKERMMKEKERMMKKII